MTQAGRCGQHALPELWAAVHTHLEAGNRHLLDADARFRDVINARDFYECSTFTPERVCAGTLFLGKQQAEPLQYTLAAAICQALPPLHAAESADAFDIIDHDISNSAAAVLSQCPGDGDWRLSWCCSAAAGRSDLRVGRRIGDSWRDAAARAASMSLLPHLLWYVRA